jgi:hypothetical protein
MLGCQISTQQPTCRAAYHNDTITKGFAYSEGMFAPAKNFQASSLQTHLGL